MGFFFTIWLRVPSRREAVFHVKVDLGNIWPVCLIHRPRLCLRWLIRVLCLQACTLARRNAEVFLKYIHRNNVSMPGPASHGQRPEQQVKGQCERNGRPAKGYERSTPLSVTETLGMQLSCLLCLFSWCWFLLVCVLFNCKRVICFLFCPPAFFHCLLCHALALMLLLLVWFRLACLLGVMIIRLCFFFAPCSHPERAASEGEPCPPLLDAEEATPGPVSAVRGVRAQHQTGERASQNGSPISIPSSVQSI